MYIDKDVSFEHGNVAPASRPFQLVRWENAVRQAPYRCPAALNNEHTMTPSLPTPALKYLGAYPDDVKLRVGQLLADTQLGERLLRKYRETHGVRTDGALFDYTLALKNRFMRSSNPLSKVMFDNKLHVIQNALGTHTTVSRVQGTRLKAKREIRVASIFRVAPEAFLKMIVVHELAHMKERDHDKAFYALCEHMEPEYHQFEFDLRLYLTQLDATGQPLWVA